MLTRKEYKKELENYEKLYKEHIQNLRIWQLLILIVLIVLPTAIPGFVLLINIDQKIKPFVFLWSYILLLFVASLLRFFIVEKTKTYSIYKPIYKNFYINDSFKYKGSKFENQKTITIIDIDFDYKKIKTECGLILSFEELESKWILLSGLHI